MNLFDGLTDEQIRALANSALQAREAARTTSAAASSDAPERRDTRPPQPPMYVPTGQFAGGSSTATSGDIGHGREQRLPPPTTAESGWNWEPETRPHRPIVPPYYAGSVGGYGRRREAVPQHPPLPVTRLPPPPEPAGPLPEPVLPPPVSQVPNVPGAVAGVSYPATSITTPAPDPHGQGRGQGQGLGFHDHVEFFQQFLRHQENTRKDEMRMFLEQQRIADRERAEAQRERDREEREERRKENETRDELFKELIQSKRKKDRVELSGDGHGYEHSKLPKMSNVNKQSRLSAANKLESFRETLNAYILTRVPEYEKEIIHWLWHFVDKYIAQHSRQIEIGL